MDYVKSMGFHLKSLFFLSFSSSTNFIHLRLNLTYFLLTRCRIIPGRRMAERKFNLKWLRTTFNIIVDILYTKKEIENVLCCPLFHLVKGLSGESQQLCLNKPLFTMVNVSMLSFLCSSHVYWYLRLNTI